MVVDFFADDDDDVRNVSVETLTCSVTVFDASDLVSLAFLFRFGICAVSNLFSVVESLSSISRVMLDDFFLSLPFLFPVVAGDVFTLDCGCFPPPKKLRISIFKNGVRQSKK